MVNDKVELLVLDAHGVVIQQRFHKILSLLAAHYGVNPIAMRERWSSHVRGLAWLESVPEDLIWRELGFSGDPQQFKQHLVSMMSPGVAYPFLPMWRSRVPVWLLSNHRSEWLHPILQAIGSEQYFDTILVSNMLGAAKPQAASFAPILDAVDDVERVLFVDDTEANVQGARALGLVGIHADPQGQWIEHVDAALGLGVSSS